METNNSTTTLFGTSVTKDNYFSDSVDAYEERKQSANPQKFARASDPEQMHANTEVTPIKEVAQVRTTESTSEATSHRRFKRELDQSTSDTSDLFKPAASFPSSENTAASKVVELVEANSQTHITADVLSKFESETPLKDYQSRLFSHYDQTDAASTLEVTPKALATLLNSMTSEMNLMRSYLVLMTQDMIRLNQQTQVPSTHSDDKSKTLVLPQSYIDKLTRADAVGNYIDEHFDEEFFTNLVDLQNEMEIQDKNWENIDQKIDDIERMYREILVAYEQAQEQAVLLQEMVESMQSVPVADTLDMMQKEQPDSLFSDQNAGAMLSGASPKKNLTPLLIGVAIIGILIIFCVYFQVWHYLPSK